MSDGLPAERYQGRYRVGLDAMAAQWPAVKTYHRRQIAASRVTGDKYVGAVAAVALNIIESPGHG